MQIVMTVLTDQGRRIDTSWINGHSFSPAEDRNRRAFIAGVYREGGKIISVRKA